MNVSQVEKAIDREFRNSPALKLPYSQAIWTLLSVVEDNDFNYRYINKLPEEQRHAYIDTVINAITHPIRAIYSANIQPSTPVEKKYIDNHYKWTQKWLKKAVIYDCFFTIFPLWHKKKITLSVNGNILKTSDWKNHQLEYEVYNRLIRKDGTKTETLLDPTPLVEEIMANVKHDETRFELNLNPKLVAHLINNYSKILIDRYKLPDDWRMSFFSFGEFKKVFIAIQAILYGRTIARFVLASNGLQGLGYSSAIWVVTLDELSARLVRYTRVKGDV